MIESTALCDWLLAGCPDAEELSQDWQEHPEAHQSVVTGTNFDAVMMPSALGRAAHGQFEWLLRHRVPAALVADDVVMLIRAGSAFGGPTVPAAIEVRRAGQTVWLPHPSHPTAWLRRLVDCRLPGFLSLPSVVREVLRIDHHMDNGWQHCDSAFPEAMATVRYEPTAV